MRLNPVDDNAKLTIEECEINPVIVPFTPLTAVVHQLDHRFGVGCLLKYGEHSTAGREYFVRCQAGDEVQAIVKEVIDRDTYLVILETHTPIREDII